MQWSVFPNIALTHCDLGTYYLQNEEWTTNKLVRQWPQKDLKTVLDAEYYATQGEYNESAGSPMHSHSHFGGI